MNMDGGNGGFTQASKISTGLFAAFFSKLRYGCLWETCVKTIPDRKCWQECRGYGFGWVPGGGAACAVWCFGPRPRAIKDSESILPVDASFWSAWKWRIASIDSWLHTPVGSPVR